MQDPTRHREASDATDAQPFISRWRAAGGSERANCQLFVTELCALLGLPAPEPAREDVRDNAYVFERRVGFAHGDGSTSSGFIDCYRRGAFVLEAKKLRAGAHTKGFDDALLRARAQAEGYARALPAAEGRPPFLVVVDVGHVIELYAEFTRSGATYTPFPDARSHRIALAELQQPEVRERLRTLFEREYLGHESGPRLEGDRSLVSAGDGAPHRLEATIHFRHGTKAHAVFADGHPVSGGVLKNDLIHSWHDSTLVVVVDFAIDQNLPKF